MNSRGWRSCAQAHVAGPRRGPEERRRQGRGRRRLSIEGRAGCASRRGGCPRCVPGRCVAADPRAPCRPGRPSCVPGGMARPPVLRGRPGRPRSRPRRLMARTPVSPCRPARPRSVPGVSWRSWQAVTAMRRPGREGSVKHPAQVRAEVGLTSKGPAREKPHLPPIGDEDAGNVTPPCAFRHFRSLSGPQMRARIRVPDFDPPMAGSKSTSRP